MCLATWIHKTTSLFEPRHVLSIATAGGLPGFQSLPLWLHLYPVSLLIAACTIFMQNSLINCSNGKSDNWEPLWQCVLSHTSCLCLNSSAGMISTVLFLLKAAVPLDSSNNHYSEQPLFIYAPSTFLACCWCGRAMWQGTSVTLETSFYHINNFKRTSFLLSILMKVTFSILPLPVYFYMAILGTIQSAQKIVCFNQSYYFLILQTIWHHKAHCRADIFKAWH